MNNKSHSTMQELLDDLTKPKGSLGKLEDYALRLSAVQKQVPPRIRRKAVFVLAGDHGVAAEGVSLYPSEVTAQMMHNFMAEGAAINVFSAHCGFDVYAVDAGVAGDLPAWPSQDASKPCTESKAGAPGFFSMKAVRGSANFAKVPALGEAGFAACIENGKALARFAVASGYDMVALGDMGIGNTTSAAAVLAALGLDLDLVVDRGTGIDDAMLARKRQVIEKALALHGPFPSNAAGALKAGQAFAGPEIATAAGLCLGLAGTGVACMLDGFPITSGACLAARIDPTSVDSMFAGHLSRVRGHRHALDMLGLDPIVALDMRLGEGTGAVLGGFIVELACKIASSMARFSQLAVSSAPSDEVDF